MTDAPDDPLDFWEARFAGAGDGYLFGTAPNDFLRREAYRLTPGSRVLSVADGEGRNSVFLAAQGHHVDALEFAPSAVSKAKALAKAQQVSVNHIEADAYTWQWPSARYDAVAAIFIQFAPPAERATLFQRILAALKPGGLLLLQGYTPKQLEYGTGGPPNVENLYTEAEIRTAFAAHTIHVLRVHEAVIDEGPGHRGMSALMDVVVEKR